MKHAAKGLALKTLGWILLPVGVAMMPLPGPGAMVVLLAMFVLATQYEWAEKRLDQVKEWALQGAADSVRTWPRIAVSVVGVVWLWSVGIVWGVGPDAPSWWPVDEKWWLVGGWATGITLIASGFVAGALIIYSYLNLRDTGEDNGTGTDAGSGRGEPAGADTQQH